MLTPAANASALARAAIDPRGAALTFPVAAAPCTARRLPAGRVATGSALVAPAAKSESLKTCVPFSVAESAVRLLGAESCMRTTYDPAPELPIADHQTKRRIRLARGIELSTADRLCQSQHDPGSRTRSHDLHLWSCQRPQSTHVVHR